MKTDGEMKRWAEVGNKQGLKGAGVTEKEANREKRV